MAVNPNNLLGQSNPNGTVGVSLGIDPAGANEAFSAGATSGFYVTPTSPAGMSVEVGGAVGVVDSALVRSASGITFPVGNVTGTPITLTVPAAPSTNSRIDSVVLYVDTSATVTLTDGADAVGIEIVSGTSASTPVAPTDAQIRAAITNGAAIAYTVLADITVSSSTTTITASNISQANRAQLGADKIDFATYSTSEKEVGKWVDGKTIYRKTWTGTYSPAQGSITTLFTYAGVNSIVAVSGYVNNANARDNFGSAHVVTGGAINTTSWAMVTSSGLQARVYTTTAGSNLPYAITIDYTKN